MELTPSIIKRASGHFDLVCVTYLDLSPAGGLSRIRVAKCRLSTVSSSLTPWRCTGISQLAHLDACVNLVELSLAKNAVRSALTCCCTGTNTCGGLLLMTHAP